jgi:rhomboid protease GluP
MYYVAGPADAHSRWIEAGAAVADRIAAGQWWRAWTALTLHADILHLAGNVVACLIFVSAVGRWLGGGAGALAILLAAGGANLLTAAVHRTDFSSLGASTATFAALGLCAGLQVVRRLRGEMRRAYAWVPLGAGLGLYAMLGVGPGADTYAHLFGLGLGALIGSAAALGNIRAPRTTAQMLLGAAALGAVVSAWVLALHGTR